MAKGALNNPIFQDSTKARLWLESLLWVDGRVCGACGTVDDSTPIKGRDGYYSCKSCRKQFTVTVGTVFERSHIPLNKWLMAAFLLCASKKGISAHQMHRMVGITYKSAWFMMHRLREAMAPAGKLPPMGGEGKYVEADETYYGNKPGMKRKHMGSKHKHPILSLVERGGAVRSFHMPVCNQATVYKVILQNVEREKTKFNTDTAPMHKRKDVFPNHETVDHSKDEYARGDATTNTVEGFFSIFKRGMSGVYQHCGEQHLHRYLAEFDFRYSNRAGLDIDDEMRAAKALKGIAGKRLTYRRINEAKNA
jgi:transposase-like protein